MGENRYRELLRSAHFLLLPSRAECYGVVLAEACAFGVPVLASETGGIGTVVKDGVNGKTFPTTQDPAVLDRAEEAKQYADFIENTLNDDYSTLALSAFEEYVGRLNWSRSAQRVTEILRDVLR